MRVTFIERTPGVWRLRVERGRDPSGKRLFSYETLRGNEEAAQRRRFEILSAHDAGSFAVPDKVTVAHFLEQYAKDRHALGRIGRGSLENYQAHFRAYVIPAIGGMKLQRVRGTDVQALYTKLLSDGRLKVSTIEHVHRLLSTAFRTARKQRLVTVNPMEEVEAPRGQKPAPKALAEADVATVVEALRGKWFETPALLALATGMRRGEVLGLRRCDVDLSAGKVRVNGQIVRYRDGSLERKAPKTKNSARTVALPREAVELLRVYVKTMLEHRMKLGLGPWRDDAALFTLDGVSWIDPAKLTDAFSAMCDAIGLPEFTFHGTRHTHATLLLKKVGPAGAKSVSQRLGHSTITMTLGTYQKVFEEDDAALAEMAGGLLGGAK